MKSNRNHTTFRDAISETSYLFPLEGCLAHNATCTAPLVGEVRRSRVGGLSKSFSSLEGGRRPDAGESKTKIFLINNRSPLTCPTGHPLPQGRGGTTCGFTLIELLVVVLIIGILAVVAVPQYEMAVWKTRYATMKHIVKTVAQAEEIYYLANGTYTPNINNWDVDFPTPTTIYILEKVSQGEYPWGSCVLFHDEDVTSYIECWYNRNGEKFLSYAMYFNHAATNAGKFYCGAKQNTDLSSVQQRICQAESNLTQPTVSTTNGWGWTY